MVQLRSGLNLAVSHLYMKAYAIKKYARKQKCGLLFEPLK